MSSEPQGSAEPPVAREERCLNCGAVLVGPYCAHCGQPLKHHVHSAWATVKEFIEDLFHADHRVWRTLLPLAFKPGLLTVEYLRGRRVAYTPPFRLYIVLSLIFFLLTSFDGGDAQRAIPGTPGATQSGAVVDPEVAALVDRLVANVPAEQRAAQRERLLQLLREDLAIARAYDVDPCARSNLEAVLPDALSNSPRILEACRRVTSRDASFERALADNIPKMMFLFLPLIALAGKLLYVRSGRYYAEHLLFFVHFHAFFFVAAMSIMAIGALFGWLEASVAGPWNTLAGLLTLAIALYVPAYLYRAMRRVYAQGRLATAGKFVLLWIAYFVFLLLTLLLLVVFTALSL